jgi:hypothetical protein
VILEADGESQAGDLENCLGGSPTLLWRIEVRKSRIEILRCHACDRLPVDVIQLLKNPAFRRQLVHADDLELLNSVMRAAQRGEGGSAVFRIPGRDAGTIWLRLSGYVDPAQPNYVWGNLSDVSDCVAAIREKAGDALAPAVPAHKSRTRHPTADVLNPAIGEDGRIEPVLAALFAHQVGPGFEGILFSDIFRRKNKVVVYSHGHPFRGMDQAKVFSFEGTIAETILTFGLDHLVVSDTLDSIKAIDWALFIPAGIRSYFAKPFFDGKTLHSVLILCSTSTDRFPEERIAEFEPLYAPFQRAVKRWRKAVKNPK